jgi:hypothetical protein
MSAADQKVELLETKALRMFIHVTREIDFGDRFLLSMLHWCGFGRRSSTLRKVFRLKNFGFIRARRMTSQSTLTRVSASNIWAALLSGRLGELWIISTSY